jgi:hypothetical protein
MCRVLYVVWRMRRASTYVHEAEIEADGMPRPTSLCGPREGWDGMDTEEVGRRKSSVAVKDYLLLLFQRLVCSYVEFGDMTCVYNQHFAS